MNSTVSSDLHIPTAPHPTVENQAKAVYDVNKLFKEPLEPSTRTYHPISLWKEEKDEETSSEEFSSSDDQISDRYERFTDDF